MKHHLYLPTFLPVSFPDVMETFLEDMAKKGWFLKKVGYFLSFCQFEKGTPAPVRYRLEPVPDTVRTPSAEMVQFYEDFGWKYLTTFSHFFFIFVAENPDTPEIHCDPLVQAKGYKRMCRNFSVFGLAALVLLTIFLGIPLYHPAFLLECPRFSAFALVTLLAFAVLILWSVLRLWKIYRNLSHGNPISHHKGYLHILSLQTIALALFVLFLLPFSDKLMEWDENDQITQSLTAVEEPLPYVPFFGGNGHFSRQGADPLRPYYHWWQEQRFQLCTQPLERSRTCHIPDQSDGLSHRPQHASRCHIHDFLLWGNGKFFSSKNRRHGFCKSLCRYPRHIGL